MSVQQLEPTLMKKFFPLIVLLLWGASSHAQTISLPHFEGFEQFNTCSGSCQVNCSLINGWSNVTGDYSDWTVDINGTSSSNTGPGVDHTLGTPTGHYLYTETSSPCFPSRTFHLVTPLCDFSGANAPQLSFWYHMYGTTMGTMHVDLSTDGGSTWSLDIIPSWTDNQDLWQEKIVDLSSYANDSIHLRIRSISGSSFESDMAVDDFNFYDLLPNDAGIARIDSPSTPACNLGQNLYATLKNYGTDTLTTCTLNVSINGSNLAPLYWTGSLASGEEDSLVFLGIAPLLPGDSICAWTSIPNGVAENITGAGNDTMCTIVNLGLSGSYTIGGGSPDFTSFTDAVNALDMQGVCGPVEFLVNDSTFQEQIVLNEVIGMNATNTVTFRSASGDRTACRLEWASFSSGDNYTLFFDGADHYIWKDINIGGLGTTYGRVIQFQNEANHNRIENCWIIGTPGVTTTSTNHCLLYSPNSLDNFNEFLGNRFEFGSYSVYWYGSGTTSLEQGSVFQNNEFLNPYYYGTRLYYQDAPDFGGNAFSTNSPYTGSVWRFYFLYCDNGLRIYNNRCEGTNYGYGIYLGNCDATNQNHGRIWNNFVYIGNPATTSTSYGIYLTNSGYQDVIANNVHLESNGSSSRALYVTGGGGNLVYNNNFYNSGPGFSIYVLSQYSMAGCDYNNLSAPNGTIGYFNTNQNTLANWQNASGFGTNSISVDPLYYSSTDLHVCNDTLDGAGWLPHMGG